MAVGNWFRTSLAFSFSLTIFSYTMVKTGHCLSSWKSRSNLRSRTQSLPFWYRNDLHSGSDKPNRGTPRDWAILVTITHTVAGFLNVNNNTEQGQITSDFTIQVHSTLARETIMHFLLLLYFYSNSKATPSSKQKRGQGGRKQTDISTCIKTT